MEKSDDPSTPKVPPGFDWAIAEEVNRLYKSGKWWIIHICCAVGFLAATGGGICEMLHFFRSLKQ